MKRIKSPQAIALATLVCIMCAPVKQIYASPVVKKEVANPIRPYSESSMLSGVFNSKLNFIPTAKTDNSTKTIDEQIEGLYDEVEKSLSLPRDLTNVLKILQSNTPNYTNTSPNIYTELTNQDHSVMLELAGAKRELTAQAPFADTSKIVTIPRPSDLYLPDHVYNVALALSKLLAENETPIKEEHSQELKDWYVTLTEEQKYKLRIYQVLFIYTNTPFGSFIDTYHELVKIKSPTEPIVSINEETKECTFNENYISLIQESGLTTALWLPKIMFNDDYLNTSGKERVRTYQRNLPYTVDNFTYNDLILAATSLVGKVRYVWGGGHLGSGDINGISPIWAEVNKEYIDNDKSAFSIKPGTSWCIQHGQTDVPDLSCLSLDKPVSNLLEFNSKHIGYTGGDYGYIFNTIESTFGAGILSHRLDGLDCSGFISWLYNQVDPDRTYDTVAKQYVDTYGMLQPKLGELRTGDVLAWDTHIMLIAGSLKPTSSTNKVYLIVEASPNVVKYGVIYLPEASAKEIETAKELAIKVNKTLGNLKEWETNVYNYTELVDKNIKTGRLNKAFKDETNTPTGLTKPVIQTEAGELVEYLLKAMPSELVINNQ